MNSGTISISVILIGGFGLNSWIPTFGLLAITGIWAMNQWMGARIASLWLLKTRFWNTRIVPKLFPVSHIKTKAVRSLGCKYYYISPQGKINHIFISNVSIGVITMPILIDIHVWCLNGVSAPAKISTIIQYKNSITHKLMCTGCSAHTWCHSKLIHNGTFNYKTILWRRGNEYTF